MQPIYITEETKGLEIIVTAEHEHSCYPDDYDADLIKAIDTNIDIDYLWGWCVVSVQLSFMGILSETIYLGMCSYSSKEEFMQEGGYYSDMVNECVEDINDRLCKINRYLNS